ncbi:Mlp family lipoprotein [Borreliella lanei]|uniref:F0F1-type ATP synthase membrane subunit b/b n=1 Tax=Borreliella lanei TaxID=373540 RepID=A0A7X0DKW7_9SPIR|nr:Mlp family lipoprotein [Borreliella lanei]MBB6208549.1 F0F1-type ATP synthase membrane subunit b/b' [Borreliella lanei]
MKIINILFCLFLLILNSCTANDTTQQPKNREKRDLSQQEAPQETPKSKEGLLKEKLSEDQKTHLDWLKTALTGAGEFDKFLENNEDKIKSALDHIKKELDKCNGNDDGKNTFKQVVQGALGGGIDKITTEASSTCNSH